MWFVTFYDYKGDFFCTPGMSESEAWLARAVLQNEGKLKVEIMCSGLAHVGTFGSAK